MTQSQPRSKRTPTLEIHGRILDAARRIVERDGVDGLTIRALSAQADVSPTSIYQHIGGKQAVCDALIGPMGELPPHGVITGEHPICFDMNAR